MEQYETLMQQHSKQAAQNDKPMETYKYFHDKWMNEAAFLELKVPEYLVCPCSNKIFDTPIMLDDGEVYDRSVLDQIPEERKKLQIPDLQLKAACDHFYDNNEWALDYIKAEGKTIEDFRLVIM